MYPINAGAMLHVGKFSIEVAISFDFPVIFNRASFYLRYCSPSIDNIIDLLTNYKG